MVWRVAPALLAAALLAAGAAASPPAQIADVAVKDTGLSPPLVAVDLGGKVRWKNTGRALHVVTSTANTFPPVRLRPGTMRAVTFTKRRCERYTVDGRFAGRIAVGGAACAGGGAPRPTPGGTTTNANGVVEQILRYDVRIVASLHQVETFTSTHPEGNGVLDLDLSWTGSWHRLELKLQTVAGSAVFVPVQGTVLRGTIGGKLKFSETRQSNGGSCGGTVEYAGLKARVTLTGGAVKGGRPYISFDASLVDDAAADEPTRVKQDAVCDGNTPGLPRWQAEGFKVLGVDVHHPPGLSIHPMDTRWSREGGPGIPFPLDRVLAHRGFTIDSGVRTARHTQTGYVQTFTGHVKYVLTPVQ